MRGRHVRLVVTVIGRVVPVLVGAALVLEVIMAMAMIVLTRVCIGKRMRVRACTQGVVRQRDRLENANSACDSISSPITPLTSTRAIFCEKMEEAANTVMAGRFREGWAPSAIGGPFYTGVRLVAGNSQRLETSGPWRELPLPGVGRNSVAGTKVGDEARRAAGGSVARMAVHPDAVCEFPRRDGAAELCNSGTERCGSNIKQHPSAWEVRF